MQKKLRLHIFLILLTLLVACGKEKDLAPAPEEISRDGGVLDETYPVDPIFEQFYQSLGGINTLGPALTPLQESGNLKIQYVDAALLVFDPQAVGSDQYRLAPLGLVFGIAEPAVPNPGVPDHRYVNGHVIYLDFTAYYDQLGGARFVGRPLTEGRYNPDKNRIEQYFENLGFYILDSDPNTVRLLAYGAFACDRRCRYQPAPASIPTLRPLLPEPFAAKVSKLGLTFIGRTLSEPYINSEGQLEIIFENLVLAVPAQASPGNGIELPFRLWLPQVLKQAIQKEEADELFRFWLPFIPVNTSTGIQSNGSILIHINIDALIKPITVFAKDQAPQVFVRPIVIMLGIPPQPVEDPSPDPLMMFYPLEEGKGHNIPIFFNDYLSRHGGFEVSGKPITRVYLLRDGVFQQCFENLCLDFDTQAAEGEQLRPAPLGVKYKERFYEGPPEEDIPEIQPLEDVRMQVWESHPFVRSNETQIIYVSIFEDNVPLMNREPDLFLSPPDDTKIEYHFPPTDENGRTSLELPPIYAPNGSLVAYEVCLPVIRGDKICVMDNYLIWNYP